MTGLSLDWIALTVLKSLQVWKKIIEIGTTNMMNAAAVAWKAGASEAAPQKNSFEW